MDTDTWTSTRNLSIGLEVPQFARNRPCKILEWCLKVCRNCTLGKRQMKCSKHCLKIISDFLLKKSKLIVTCAKSRQPKTSHSKNGVFHGQSALLVPRRKRFVWKVHTLLMMELKKVCLHSSWFPMSEPFHISALYSTKIG